MPPDPELSAEKAYRITAAVRAIREGRGEKAMGRKIGLTNVLAWEAYGISDPIWGYMYDTTIYPIERQPCVAVTGFLEPRIEPEICFGVTAPPSTRMDEKALLSCIGWVAHGFEIVQSLYPEWKQGVGDAIAAHGMHGLFIMGKAYQILPHERESWLKRLSTFEVELACNGAIVDRGNATNVLGGPLTALRHLVALLSRDPDNPVLTAGEIVTTGSITGAFPVTAGETWSTFVDGLPLEGITLRIE